MSSGLVFWLHLAVQSILVLFDLVFNILLFFFVVAIKLFRVFDFERKLAEQRMVFQVRKLHSLFRVNNKYSSEKIFNLRRHIFQLLLFCNSGLETKIRMTASPIDFCLHIVSFERILSKKHEIKKHAQSPNINGNSVIRVTDDFRRHVFLSPTMSFSTSATNRSGKTKVSYFVPNVVRVLVLEYLFQ